HLHLLGKDQYNFMMKLGKRIRAFHVHDNDGASDQHIAPYMGTIVWDRFIQGLHDLNFSGTMDFETFNVWTRMDPEIAAHMMKVIAATGRMFAERAGV
ncbi:MAG: sugar phosphate isomerase/epimerase, partial [Spirochaetales bacterium]|nr:sugar phosphate isomerase/epimerase [Spirochaetales bacterium]